MKKKTKQQKKKKKYPKTYIDENIEKQYEIHKK